MAVVVVDTDVASSIIRGKPAAAVSRALAPHVLPPGPRRCRRPGLEMWSGPARNWWSG